MNVQVSKIRGYNNGILVEKMVPPKGERSTPGGIIIPEGAQGPTHVFSKVRHVGFSCSRRINVGDYVVAEKTMKTTLIDVDSGRELLFARETDIIGHVHAEDYEDEGGA